MSSQKFRFNEGQDAHTGLSAALLNEHDRNVEDPEEEFRSEGDFLEDNAEGNTSVTSATFNLVTTVIGSGIMAIPYVFKILGVGGAAILSVVVCLASAASARMLVLASAPDRQSSYGQVVDEVMGLAWRSVLNLCITFNNMGVLVVFLDIIGDCLVGVNHGSKAEALPGLLQNWLKGVDDIPPVLLSRPVVLGIVLVFIITPTSLRRTFNGMKYTSMYSVGFSAFFVLVTVVLSMFYASTGKRIHVHWFPEPETNWLQMISTIPVTMSAFICHYNVNPLMSELQQPKAKNMNKVVGYTMTFCCSLNIIVGFCAMMLFGDDVRTDILSNFGHDLKIPYAAVLVAIVRVGYIISLAFTFPVILFTLRDSLLDIVPCAMNKESSLTFYSISILILLVEYVIALAVPDIYDAIGLMASTVTMLLGFVIPALITIKLARGKLCITLMSSGMFWVGLAIGILGFSITTTHIIQKAG